ncbi:2-oxoglutarate dehydrogenase complex dihydrolipoyllysine-residue succinyltransferase [Mucilaginibacter arboris]|uniref:Dihydrolipoyllysine-residue succinyltransferase component of 2-oxoglutarate dehydrogenase complex n=1 Tax=Mucilaginibacter arboris TaxID=2682090 RepID=A0A7K1SWQ1_9SPHI|nr:2-oxoglutarate dehydrogenase complex dihydrolipoyllysine-residue succinyltransferase [Mucilaginibacter arboris]MVN21713.1 2-oxoglutarate dehydrogenase complex dihydrolipoyllysine-residue succinyltransferase [Mucilaginibacter arboris]
MSLEIKVPPVGESISEVTLSNWVKNDGDHVEMDDVIAELESDKATFELTAEAAGTLRTTAKEGDVLAIGDVVCTIESADAATAPAEKTPVKEASAETKPVNTEPASAEAPKTVTASAAQEIEIKIPAVGESIQEVTLTRWMKKDGEQVEMDEPIAELESDKATFELNAESAGTLTTIAQEGDVVMIGALVGKIKAGAGAPQTEKTPVKEVAEKAEISAGSGDQPKTYASGVPSPAAAKILAERGLDPKNINGNGVGGRITKEDAQKAEVSKPTAKTESKPAPAPAKPAAPAPQPVVAGSRGERREKMSSLRKTVAKRLVAVKNETAMLTTFNEVDMQPIMELRSKYKDKFKEKHQVGLGFMSFFTKAVTEALKDWPAVGARIEGEEVVYSNFADISIAVSAPKGLVVPIIRNADSMSLAEIEKAIVALAGKARENKLTIDEMTGGTFTITNGGVFGSMLSTPIINSPQSAILGMHNIIERPVAVNGQVVIRPMMYLALSYDHRIVDGRESVSFLVRVKQLLEDPARLLLGV